MGSGGFANPPGIYGETALPPPTSLNCSIFTVPAGNLAETSNSPPKAFTIRRRGKGDVANYPLPKRTATAVQTRLRRVPSPSVCQLAPFSSLRLGVSPSCSPAFVAPPRLGVSPFLHDEPLSLFRAVPSVPWSIESPSTSLTYTLARPWPRRGPGQSAPPGFWNGSTFSAERVNRNHLKNVQKELARSRSGSRK